MEELLFKKGQLANLPKERQTGTFYVTEDAKTIYIDNMVIQDTEDVKEELIGIIVDNELVTAEGLTYLNENKADITALNAVEDKIPVKTSQLTNDSGYITLNEVPEVDLSGYSQTGHTHDDLYYTETEIDTKLNGKQDTISDLETIRSGAALGATALQAVPKEYATKEYVGGEVSKLVGSAPETLNTLEELAQALNNNADIVTVLNESIATKASIDDLSAYTTNDLHEGLKAEVEENEYAAAKALTKLNNEKANKSEIPTLLSQLTNDSGFITASQVPTQDLSGYVTTEALDAKGYLNEIPSEYVTETELNDKGYLTAIPSEYVTESELSAKKYLTAIPSEYITETELEAKKYLTSVPSEYVTETELAQKQDVISDLETIRSGAALGATALQSVPDTYVTESELTNKGYLTAIPSEYITETELEAKGYLTSVPSEYVTETELNDKGYLNAIPSEYVTETELDAKGYLTSVPDGYVTETELTNKGYLTEIPNTYALKTDIPDVSKFISEIPSEYVTETELSAKKYLTSVPSEYVTETELEAKKYLTAIPSEYITEAELSAKNYLYKVEITQEDYNALETKDKNALYVIIDSNQDDESRFVTIAEMNTKISEMQALITSLQGEITTLKNELNKTLVVE